MEWYQRAEAHDGHDDHGAVDTWWNLPWYAVPETRHQWGEPQQPLHPGASELFLDLIFVGTAYRVGVVMKAAFYACSPTDDACSGEGSKLIPSCHSESDRGAAAGSGAA